MTQEQVNLFLAIRGKYFEPEHLPYIREQLLATDESKVQALNYLEFQDPTLLLIVSIIGGALGLDRFLLGDPTMGVLKLITGGGCGIWAIVDLFLIMGLTRKKNFFILDQFLSIR